MRRKCGFILLEWLIALAIMALIVPTVFQTYLTIHRHIRLLGQERLEMLELNFIEDMLRNDLETSVSVTLDSEFLMLTDREGRTIYYEFQAPVLRRKLNGSTLILNQTQLSEFEISRQSALYRIVLRTDSVKREWQVYVPGS